MAIKLNIINESGILTTYHNIKRIEWIKGFGTRVSIASYLNSEARKTKQPAMIKMYKVEGISLNEIYTYLKVHQFRGGPNNYPEDC